VYFTTGHELTIHEKVVCWTAYITLYSIYALRILGGRTPRTPPLNPPLITPPMRCFWLMLPREYTLHMQNFSHTYRYPIVLLLNKFKYWFFWNFGIQYKVDSSQFSSFIGIFSDDMNDFSPRFLCRPTTLYIIARAVERQSAIYTENSWFASPALGRHISTFRGYRILLTIRNPYINRFTNHFSIHS
jgi:hypothetical protein